MSWPPLDVTPSWWRQPTRPTLAEVESAVRGLLDAGAVFMVISDQRILTMRPGRSHPARVDAQLAAAVKPQKGTRMQFRAHKHRRQRVDVTPSWFGKHGHGSADIAGAVRRLCDTGCVRSVTVFEDGIHVVACLANFDKASCDQLRQIAEGGQES